VTDEERLLAEIREHPADDAPRAVYADFLTRRGDERGEYVTLALGYAREELSREQIARYLELDRHDARWADELGCDGVQVVRWRRGFPEVISAKLDNVERLAALLRRLPFRGLSLGHAAGDAAALARLPELARIEELSLRGPLVKSRNSWAWGEFPAAELGALVASPHWTALRRFELEEGALSDTGAEIIGAAPWLAQLAELAIVKATATGAGLARLFARPLPHLHQLRVWNTPVGDAGARAIAGADLPALANVALGLARVTPDGARALFGSRNLARVATLELRENDLAGSLATLARSPHAAALHELVLEQDHLTDDDAVALAGAAALTGLVTLRLANNAIGDTGAAALAASRALPRLATLDLGYNHLTRAGVMPFTVTAPPALATLRITGNPLPTGRYEQVVYTDQGFEVGGASVDVPYTTDQVRAWFAETGSPLEIS